MSVTRLARTAAAMSVTTLVAAGLVITGAGPASATSTSPCGAHGVFTTDDGLDTCTYSPISGPDTFTKPAGITSVHFDLLGAGGQSTNPSAPWEGGHCGGWQGHTWGDLPTTSASQVFQVNVGGQGSCDSAGGWNGGGSGGHASTDDPNGAGGNGATDIRTGSDTLGDRILVAAGSGGNGGPTNHFTFGGSGGGLVGSDGSSGHITEGGAPGTGGTQTGAGATPGSGDSAGFGFGGGGGDYLAVGGGGGGGGGWYGGGGGQGGLDGGGGGGGSSYVSPAFINQGTSSNQDPTTLQTGQATITWNDPVTTTLSLAPSSAAPGSVVIGAYTTPATATGSVDFSLKSGSTTTDLGSGSISSGLATVTTSALPPGADTIIATYTGDSRHQAATQQGVIDIGLVPRVTTQPTDQNGPSGAVLGFTAAASGTPTPSIQWQESTDGGTTWTNLSGATQGTVYLTSENPPPALFEYYVTNGTKVRAVFTNLMGSATSDAATYSDLSAPVILNNPNPVNNLFPGGFLDIRANAIAEPAATVQWQVSTNSGGTWANVSGPNVTGATTNELTITNVTLDMNGYQYRAAYTNSIGTTYSNVANVSVTSPTACFVANPTPANYSHCAGVDLHGQNLSGINLSFADLSGANLSGANLTGATFQAANLQGANLSGTGGAGTYADDLKFASFLYANLTGANLTGEDFTYTSLLGANLTNTIFVPASVTVVPQSAAGSVVTWSDPGIPGAVLDTCSSASGSTFAVGSTTVDCVVDSTDPEVGCSPSPCTGHGSFTVTVSAPVAPVLNPVLGDPYDYTVAPGKFASFISVATGTPAPAVQWQVSTDWGGTWNDIPGATSITLQFAADLSQNGNLYRAVQSNFAGSVTTTAARLTVKWPDLWIVPDDQHVIYGAPLPALTWQLYGPTPDGDPSLLTGTVACDLVNPEPTPIPAGNYPIQCSGVTADQYTVNFAVGTLFVAPAPVTVKSLPITTVYGGPLPTDGGAVVNGLVAPDTLANLGGSCTLPLLPDGHTPPVGTFSDFVKCSGIVSPNYAVTYLPAPLTVVPAFLHVVASSPSMTYGGLVPPITPTYQGLVNGDDEHAIAPPSCSTAATSASTVGSYPSACINAANPNYQISYDFGSVTVNPALATVTASSLVMTYGGTPPPVTAQVAGLVNGDQPNALGFLSCMTSVSASTAPGVYPGADTCSGAYDPNYTVSYVAGDAVVTPTDGEGTAVLNWKALNAGALRKEVVLTYTAGPDGMTGGTVQVTVPAGWTAPQTLNQGGAGFVSTTCSSTRSAAGNVVTASGVNLAAGATCTVTIGDTSFGGAGETVPATAGPATFAVATRTSALGTLTPIASSPSLNVKPSPAVTGLSPAIGGLGGGETVTVSGSGFAAGDTVTLTRGTTTLTASGVTVNSPSSLTFTTPAASILGKWTVHVRTGAGVSSASSAADVFTYQLAATGLAPVSGPRAGGTPVIITGVGFTPSDTVVVSLGSTVPGTVTLLNIDVVSPTTITATMPAGKAGARRIYVVTPTGVRTTGLVFTYT